MTGAQGSARLTLVAIVFVGALGLACGSGQSRAGSVISTLDLSLDGTFPGEQVGAAIQVGSTPIREAVGRLKTVPLNGRLLRTARALGISLGD